MPDDANIDLKTVIKTCKVDVVKEVKADKNLQASVAGDNLKQGSDRTDHHTDRRG